MAKAGLQMNVACVLCVCHRYIIAKRKHKLESSTLGKQSLMSSLSTYRQALSQTIIYRGSIKQINSSKQNAGT